MIVGAYDSLCEWEIVYLELKEERVSDPILEFISGAHHARLWSVVLSTCLLLVQHKLANKDGSFNRWYVRLCNCNFGLITHVFVHITSFLLEQKSRFTLIS